MKLRFKLLGPARGWREGVELDLGPPQRRAVLVMLLLLRGRVARAEDLVDGIWGDDPPETAAAVVRTHVAILRKLLEPDRQPNERAAVLVSTGGGYALRLADDALDLAEFERLVAASRDRGDALEMLGEALALWEGEALAGVPGPFAARHRVALAEERLAAVEARLELEVRHGGGGAGLIGELSALVADHPMRERPRGLLMRALAAAGRTAEAVGVYDDGRRLLDAELGIEPGPELAAVRRELLDVRHEPPPSGLPAPAQLPADLGDFTGRTAVAARLVDTLTTRAEGPVVVSVVAGMGGVGKTTLAVHVAHAVRESFPDGQLYVNLRGVDAEPMRPEEALAGFLRALGVARDDLPDSLAERSALLRSMTGGGRWLFLLDNARDAAQVGPLLPGGGGSAVVITGRGSLAGVPGAWHVPLDVLEPSEALELLGRIIGAERVAGERAAAHDLVAACGFLPLAVRIVGARLATRPAWSIEMITKRLADERRRLTELSVSSLAVESSFALSYDLLSADQARAFRLLALPDTPDLPLDAAAAVLDLPLDQAEELVEALVDAHLVESPAMGRYRYHDLVRLYARKASSDGEEAVARLLDHYRAGAYAVHREQRPGDVLPDRLSPTTRTAFFDVSAEIRHLVAVIRQTAAVSAPLGTDLLFLLTLLSHAASDEETARTAAELLAAAPDPGTKARAQWAVAKIAHERSRFAEASAACEAALELGRAAADPVTEANALHLLARIALMRGDHPRAVELCQEGVGAARRMSNLAEEAHTLGTLARAQSALGLHEEALASASSVVRVAEELGNVPLLTYGRYERGLLLAAAGRPVEAIAALGECLAAYRADGDRMWEAGTLARIAAAWLDLGDLSRALAHAEPAAAIAKEIGHPFILGLALTQLGRALDGLGQRARAAECLREAHDLFTALDVPEATQVAALIHS